ncbi:unnamed protein product [Gongylonema pulchrum]|uniref:ANF_receptor domain-containing protein n=1 Tax=Gongylonema pulchrum TaxID=637853 RepID=A0A183D7Y5_9BILA|nr:unnamed protein product [Gongylonema pulchrum]
MCAARFAGIIAAADTSPFYNLNAVREAVSAVAACQIAGVIRKNATRHRQQYPDDLGVRPFLALAVIGTVHNSLVKLFCNGSFHFNQPMLYFNETFEHNLLNQNYPDAVTCSGVRHSPPTTTEEIDEQKN